MTAEFTIREVEERDAGGIARLAKKCPPLRTSVEGTYEYLAICFKRYFLLAESRGEIIGFVVGFPSLEGDIWIYQIAADPKHRRKNIGSSLLAEALKRFQTDGYKNIYARALKSNDPSLKLLKKFGFNKKRTLKEWVEMEKVIP